MWLFLVSIHVSCLLPFYQCDEPNSTPCEFFAGTAAAVRYSQSYFCSKVSISSSPNFSPQHKCSCSNHSGGFCWTVSDSLMSSLYCGLTAGYSRQACCSEFWAKTIITSSCSPRCLWVFLLLGHTLASVQLTVPKKPRAFPTGLLPKQLIPSLCHLEGFICPRTFVLALVHKVPTAPFPQSLNCRMTALWLSMGAAPTPLFRVKSKQDEQRVCKCL